MSGTVNISRSIWQDAAFKDQTFTEREAFMWMIMEASYKDREKRIGNITVDLGRGQLATSVRFMAEAWGWSKSAVDRFLKRLEKRDMIGTASGTGINVITICKYDEYQNKPAKSGTAKIQKRDSSGTAAGQQRDKPNKGLIPDAIKGSGSATRKPAPKPDIVSLLSEVCSPAVARDFVDHRSEIKKPITELAAKRIVDRLSGHRDPDAVLNLSIENGWQGIFPEKVGFNGNGNYSQQPGSGARPDAALENIARLAGLGAA